MVFCGISICIICNTDGVSDATLLCFTSNSRQLPNKVLNIYSPHLNFHSLYHNHHTKEAFICHSKSF